MSVLPTNPSDRNARAYNKEERALLDAYKEEYLKTSTPKERGDIVRTRMLKALTTHWDKHGIKYDPQKAQTDLLKWAQNLWRIPTVKGTASSSKVLTVRKFDVVARTMKDKVEAEIDTILGPENAHIPAKRFGVYTTAVSQVIKNLTPEASRKLDADVSNISAQGYPEEIRRQLVEKYYEKRLKDSAEANWKEMGLHAVTFVAFEDSTGRIVAEIHDDIAELLGLKTGLKVKSFEQTYPKQAREMQRLMIEYVRSLIDKSQGKETTSPQPNTLGISDDGFPLISASYDKDNLHKSEASKLYREYLSAHYKLATNNRTEQCPYDSLVKDTSSFIKPEYLPDGFVFRDPHNTQLESIKEFFDHIVERERSLPPAQVFRFHNVTTARINGTIVPSSYPDDVKDSIGEEIDLTTKPKRQKKRATKKAQKQSLVTAEEDAHSDSGPRINVACDTDVIPRLQASGELHSRLQNDGESHTDSASRLLVNGESHAKAVPCLHVNGESNTNSPPRVQVNGELHAAGPRLQVNGESHTEAVHRLQLNGETHTNIAPRLQANSKLHTEVVPYNEISDQHYSKDNVNASAVTDLDRWLQMNGEYHSTPGPSSQVGLDEGFSAFTLDNDNMFQYLYNNGAFSFPDFTTGTPIASGSGSSENNFASFPEVSFTQMLMDDQPIPNVSLPVSNPFGNTNAKDIAEHESEMPSLARINGSHTGITNAASTNGNFIRNSNNTDPERLGGEALPRNRHSHGQSDTDPSLPTEKTFIWRPVTISDANQPSSTERVTGKNSIPNDSSSSNVETAMKTRTEEATIPISNVEMPLKTRAVPKPKGQPTKRKDNISQSSPVHIFNKVLNDIPMTPTKSASITKSNLTSSMQVTTASRETPQGNSTQAAQTVIDRSLKRKGHTHKVIDNEKDSRPTKRYLSADELAAHEANKMKVGGKRVPKKRVLG
ncbi:hypothetical protein JR316_0006497 [Psilocybe cubensis]|uniref:Uncharacterized protein n=2 Tax=Psilocybe cubensis TaxID=181762 RepID=A0ACB8H2S8_PSICU|nr:hypothetical protein JR316_0006497 [Psilocybe cubensis]KAH9481967.1 hypothetical protein JR316_0006497 [Psilocybe cubensis]